MISEGFRAQAVEDVIKFIDAKIDELNDSNEFHNMARMVELMSVRTELKERRKAIYHGNLIGGEEGEYGENSIQKGT